MLDVLIQWSLKNRAAVLILVLVLMVMGWTTLKRMSVDVFPDLTAPTVTVITEAKGMAPLAMESQVTFPIEAVVNGAPGVRRVRSATSVGISVVWVEFDWGTDIYRARQIVTEKLSLIGSDLPAEAERPVLAPITSLMGEIVLAGLTSKQHSGIELRTYADTVIRRRLLAVPGVAQVTPIGGDRKQFQVQFSEEKLRAFELSFEELEQALKLSSRDLSAGFLNESGSEYLVEAKGRVLTVEDIADTVVASRDGVGIRVKDLGRVIIGPAPKRGDASVNGERGVLLIIQKQPGANTLALTRALDLEFESLKAGMPAGMDLNAQIFRQSTFIALALRNVQHALRDGALLVVVITVLFLANLRASFITLLAIPVSLFLTVLVLYGLGEGLNTMTLGGMAIAIGALVDDAVIDVENVFRRLRENQHRPLEQRRSVLSVVYQASAEIRSSIVFATLIIVLVFLPLFFLSGVEGRLLRPLGLAYVVALLASLLVAVTLTPVLCSLILPSAKALDSDHEWVFLRFLKSAYARLLAFCMPRPWLVTAPAVGLFVASLLAATQLGRSFLPEFNEGALTVIAVTLPGTSLAESDKLGALLEERVLKQPEVLALGRRTGRAELDDHVSGVETTEIEVSLSMKGRSKQALMKALREDLKAVPGMNVTIGQPISHRIDHMLSGTRASLAVKIFGEDLSVLRALAQEVKQAMASVPGVVDLAVEQQSHIPMLTVRFRRARMARYGAQVEQVSKVLESAVQGLVVTQVLEGRNAFDMVLQLKPAEALRVGSLQDLLIDTPAGVRVPLKDLADLRRDLGPNMVSREQVERKIVVSCNVSDRDIISLVEDCRARVEPIVRGRGYRVEFGGQFESANEASRRLLWLSLVVFCGVVFLLYSAFGSVRDALFVMFNLPLAVIGGIAGVFLTGGTLSVASLIGFIAVFGVATRNGLMLVSHYRHLMLEEGVTELYEAVMRGSLERLVPILMTALASALALVPLALGAGQAGNEIQTPMAIVMLCGLTTSLSLNMVVIPALYLRFGRLLSPEENRRESFH